MGQEARRRGDRRDWRANWKLWRTTPSPYFRLSPLASQPSPPQPPGTAAGTPSIIGCYPVYSGWGGPVTDASPEATASSTAPAGGKAAHTLEEGPRTSSGPRRHQPRPHPPSGGEVSKEGASGQGDGGGDINLGGRGELGGWAAERGEGRLTAPAAATARSLTW